MAEQTAVVKVGITQPGVEYVTNQLVQEEKKGLKFPANYSIQNAMNSAYLMLKEAETKDGQPLLSVCTQESVVLSLTQMATQGLNPVKKQCYFVAYGNKCKLVPSYFGTLAILNRVKDLKRQPISNVVRQGDVFEYGYNQDMDLVIYKHETKIENLDNPILAVYAIIMTDKEKVVEIMSRQQLENAWGQGQSWKSAKKGGYESATHSKFSEEMAKKTVLNRASKKLINATDDSSIMGDQFIEAFNETSDNDAIDVTQASVQQQIETNANTEEFIEPEVLQGEVVNTKKPVESKKPEAKQQKPPVNAPEVPDWMNQEG
jgi:recombination protein RecT